MKILKRTADRLEKENHAEIARLFDMTRQGVNIWIKRRSIPDKYIEGLSDYVGIQIK